MKNAWSFLVGLQIIVPVLAQNQEVPASGVQDAQEVLAHIEESQEAVPPKESRAQQIKKFTFLADWLNRSRDCLSGIGCSKKKSYLANYALGVAIGFGIGSGFFYYPQVAQKTTLLLLIVQELGYRYTVKEPVHLFRCLTFRGCSDQTKRYAFFRLGIITGGISFTLVNLQYVKWIKTPRDKLLRKEAKRYRAQRESLRQEYVEVAEDAIQSELGLSPSQTFYEWYKVLGFNQAPSKQEADKELKKRALTYHPDKNPSEIAKEVMQVLTDTGEKMKTFYEGAELLPSSKGSLLMGE